MLKNNLECYEASAKRFDEKIGALKNYDEAYGFFVSQLKGGKLLDTACGPGNISRFVVKNWNELKNPEANAASSPEITLMDLSGEMLKVAKNHIPGAETLCCSIVDFDLGQNVFDGIIDGFGLPYLSESEGLLHFKTVYKSLKTGGIFYLSFMNAADSKRNGKATFIQNENPSFNPEAEITVTYWQQDFVVSELKKAGFKLLKKWNLDYVESDGSITTDVVIAAEKSDE